MDVSFTLKETVSHGILIVEKRPDMYTSIDRRIFPRVEGKVAVRYGEGDSEREHWTMTKDISGGGMRIRLSKRLIAGTILDLEIARKRSNTTSRCRGEIVWVSQCEEKEECCFEAGIRFIGLNLLFVNKLIGDLESLNPEQRVGISPC